MRSHEDPEVWQAAVALAKGLYQVTAMFPREEQFGLTVQMRRAAVSVASNIAEGAARQGTKEFIPSLYVASGSASELLTQCEIAKAVVGSQAKEIERLEAETAAVAKMLRALIRSLKDR